MTQYSAKVALVSITYGKITRTKTSVKLASLPSITNTVTIETVVNSRPTIGQIFPRGMK